MVPSPRVAVLLRTSVGVSPASSSGRLASVVLVSGAVLSVSEAVTVHTGLVEGVDDDPHHAEDDQVAQAGGGLVVVVVLTVVVVITPLAATEPSSPSALPLLLPPLPGQLQGVLQTAGPGQDVLVLRVVVALAHHLHLPEPHPALHVGLALPLNVSAVPASVVALDHSRLISSTSARAAHTGELGDRGAPPACGHGSVLECQHLHVSQSDLLMLLSPPPARHYQWGQQ